ncbi:MAG: hypothetical protein EHM70_17845 [Chloroflexota bacterium]|nr:MAG: hypothetical protein EHM70_17845 [Chloroflexota bacterium]
MYNIDTDLLFPPRAIPALRALRGEPWQELVDRVMVQEPTAADRLAFVLMMIRLSGCVSCHADSFRALRGCTQCAYQTVRRYRGSDQDLLTLFADAHTEMEKYMGK